MTIPAPVPPFSAWTLIDYSVERKIYGVELTLAPEETPFYFKTSVEQQRHEGIMPWGAIQYSDFEIQMPVDYTTNNLMFESGYRNRETTAVLMAGYSDFNYDNDSLSTYDGTDLEEYSTPADNYSYNFGGRLVQQLPKDNVLALKATYTWNKSEADWSNYTTITSPSADGDYDGDVEYIRANAVLTTQYSKMFETRLFYNYVDRNNDSEEITSIDGGVRTNHLFEYDKNEAGLGANYRFNKSNKLSGGYEFSNTNRNREDADSTTDNLVFAQLKNTSL